MATATVAGSAGRGENGQLRHVSAAALRRIVRRAPNESTLAVALYLDEVADDTGVVSVPRDQMVAEIGLSPTSVSKGIDLLREHGLIEQLSKTPQPWRFRIVPLRDRDEKPMRHAPKRRAGSDN